MHLTREVTARQASLDMHQIARDHYDAVYRFCARRVGPDRAADVAQETFLTTQKSLPRFRGESSIRTWVFGIALNECRRSCRKRGIEGASLEFAIDQAADGQSDGTIVDRELLRQALSNLSEDHREVVLLHEMEGLTYEEVAAVLEVPVGTVKSRLHHAFANLRRSMAGKEEGA
jgi:RNA polymerase sigma-70 factor (ECF subfamily)